MSIYANPINNNPSNLQQRNGLLYFSQKLRTSDPPYCQFWDLEFGIRAIFKNIKNLIASQTNTIQTILLDLYFLDQNDLDAFAGFIEGTVGKTRNVLIYWTNQTDMMNLINGICQYQSGELLSEDQLNQGYSDANSTIWQ